MAEGTEYLDGGHLVQFYNRDEELAERVAGYVAGAVDGGSAAVVIATPGHRQALTARLARAGVDLAEAARRGLYRALDARDTLDALMPDGELDPDRFEQVIGTVIKAVGQGGRPVRAYGEMVFLLWDDGLVNAAVQLEEMWNQLARRHSFSLLCSYPAASVLDVNCKLHGVDNLYVTDASFFPSSGAVNPALTVMANALRVGDHLLDRLDAHVRPAAVSMGNAKPVEVLS